MVKIWKTPGNLGQTLIILPLWKHCPFFTFGAFGLLEMQLYSRTNPLHYSSSQNKVYTFYLSSHKPKSHPAVCIISEELIHFPFPWAFFDGASEDLTWGWGHTLYLTQIYQYKIQMGLGKGTNNFVEHLTLKLLLCFALKKNVQNCKFLVTQWS